MREQRLSGAALMLIMCLLPILIFYGLLLFGITINPLFVLLILVLCCLAMFHWAAGACGHHTAEATQHDTDEEPIPVGEGDIEQLSGVFRPTSRRQVGQALVIEGELLQDADEAYQTLKQRFQDTNVTPLLQEDEGQQPRVVLLPGRWEQAATKDRSPWINLALFLATIVTTTWAGALHQGVNLLAEPSRFTVGLPYSLTLMLILGAHELGHYFAARAHGMKVTLPFFIPVPFALGTFGAFIQLKSPSETRRALFDVGVAGPLAGLVFAVPALWIGLGMSDVVPPSDEPVAFHHGTTVGSSILLAGMAKLTLGEAISQGHVLALHPLAFAGWLGLLVTALNLLPIGQLDGGHIADAMFGQRRSTAISSAALISLFLLGLFVWSGLLFWAIIAFFIAGAKGIPAMNDVTKLDVGRSTLGALAFLLLFLILIPVPHAFWESLGIHCPYL
ncbi:MAG: site-2 protease family protein [Planctomycetota bacterium]|nr:MAG: site-2 protease family protein [Planctomycetota bacterium]REK39317.1 MAG: site-2 protease family protein [Planctomycetota bacterium]